MVSSTFDFYHALTERWKNLFHPSKPQEKEKIPSLTSLAQRILLNPSHLACQLLPTRPHSLIERILPNGFKILIQERQNPNAEMPVASMRLVVKAGHLHEEENEIGLAHLVEHALFQGTANFSREQIEELFKSLGCRPGADSNARTGFESTVYQLDNIPTQNEEKWKTCIHLFYEFCTAVAFPEEYMVKERGIVLDELLNRQGANHDASLHRYMVDFPNSRYVHRFPGKLSEQIQKATSKELVAMLKAFYSKWYCPQNMSLILVGDFGDSLFEVKKRNALIKEVETLFTQIPPHLSPPLDHLDSSLNKEMQVIAPWRKELRTSCFHHSNFSSDTMALSRRLTLSKQTDIEKSKQLVASDLFQNILYQRLTFIKTQRNSPLIAWNEYTDSVQFEDSRLTVFQISAIHQRAKEALTLVNREFKRLELYGCQELFLEAYLEDKRQKYLEIIINAPTGLFSSIIESSVKNLTKQEPFHLQIHQVYRLFLINQLNREELNQRVKETAKLMTNSQQQDLSLLLFTPSKMETERTHQVEELKQTLEDPALYLDIVPPQYMAAEDSWLSDLKNLSSIPSIESKELISIPARSWRFANGIKVLYKPVSSLNSNLFLEFIVPNGCLSLSSRRHFLHLLYAIQVLNQIGLRNKSFSDLEIVKRKNHILSIKASLTNDTWSLFFQLNQGDNLETALQLLYVYLTDQTAILSEEFARCWESTTNKSVTFMQKWLETEQGALVSAQTSLKVEEHPILKMPSSEEIQALDLKEAQQVLIQCLQQFSKGCLLICGGEIKQENVNTLLEKYIGSLSASPNVKLLTIPPLSFTPGRQLILEEGRVANRSSTFFYFPVKNIRDPQTNAYLNIAQTILHFYLNQKIRKEQQLLYGLQFNLTFMSTLFDQLATLSLQSETDKLPSLIEDVWRTLESILNLPENEWEDLLEKHKTEKRRVFANQKKNSQSWFHTLSLFIKDGHAPEIFQGEEEWLESMTAADLKKIVTMLLERRSEFKRLTLHPKTNTLSVTG